MYREERRSLNFTKKECGSSMQKRKTPSQIHRDGVWLLYTEKRGTLSISQRRNVAPLYREERHSLLFTEKECGSSIQRRKTLYREGVWLSTEKRDTLLSSERRSVVPVCKE